MKGPGPDLPFNPFVDVAVGNPWKSAEPDVRNINVKAYQGVIRLVEQLRRTPHLAALVLGSAGGGKTHLIKRFIQSHDIDVVFVYVHPIKDHNRAFTSLVEQVATDLATRLPWASANVRVTQLDLIVAHVIAAAFEDYLEHNPHDPGRIFLKTIKMAPLKIFTFQTSPKWNDLITNAEEFLRDRTSFQGPTSKSVLRAAFQYLDKTKREAVRTFLGGTIPDQEDCDALGLRFSEGDWSLEAQEERSKHVLKTIGGLLEFYRPMVLCFDQLDSLESPDLIRSIGTLFMDIVNETENILPIGFARPENWENRFKKHLDTAAAQRMESEILSLHGCSSEQALEIVRERLAWAYSTISANPPDPFFPLERPALEKRLKGVTSPRGVLSAANQMLKDSKTEAVGEDPIEVLKRSFESEWEKLLAMGEPEPARQDTITAAFELYFKHRAEDCGYRVGAIEASGGDIRLHVHPVKKELGPRIVRMRIETGQHWMSLGRSLGRLKRSLEDQAADFAFFIRDDRSHIPPRKGAMPRTVEKLAEFERAGGQTVYIDYRTLSALYALVYTWDKIGSGDLSYVTKEDGERREVDRDAFLSFVRHGFTSNVLTRMESQFLGQQPPKRKKGVRVSSRKEKELRDAIILILRKTPYKFTSDQILAGLQRENLAKDLSHDLLAELLGKHQDQFECIGVTPPIYFLKSNVS